MMPVAWTRVFNERSRASENSILSPRRWRRDRPGKRRPAPADRQRRLLGPRDGRAREGGRADRRRLQADGLTASRVTARVSSPEITRSASRARRRDAAAGATKPRRQKAAAADVRRPSAGRRDANAAAPNRHPTRGLLQLNKGDHVAIIGNALAGPDAARRLARDARSTPSFPTHELVFRNLAVAGDEVVTRHRSENFGTPDEWLTKVQGRTSSSRSSASTNRSRARRGCRSSRPTSTSSSRRRSAKKYSGKGPPRVVLFSPIANEKHPDPNFSTPAANQREPRALHQRDGRSREVERRARSWTCSRRRRSCTPRPRARSSRSRSTACT